MTFEFTHADSDVESSLVYEAYYNENDQKLAVVLDGGYGYVYPNVPKHVFDTLVTSASPGGIYNYTLKRNYGPSESLGYVGYENRREFRTLVGAATVGTPKGLTYASDAKVTGIDLSAGRVTLTTVPGNTERKFAVTFEVNDQTRSHTPAGVNTFGEAEDAILEIGSMLGLEFKVKEIALVE